MQTASMEETMGTPIVSSVIPKLERIIRCPSAVEPPWLPIAGIIKGLHPSSFGKSHTVLIVNAMLATPRLPAVTAIDIPGVNFLLKFLLAN